MAMAQTFSSDCLCCPRLLPAPLLIIIKVKGNMADIHCNITICKEEVDKIVTNPTFCQQEDGRAKAMEALLKCVYEKDRKGACHPGVRSQTPDVAKLIDNQATSCGIRQGKATCNGPEYFLCVGGLGAFAFVGNAFDLNDLTTSCVQIKQYLQTIDICKSCVGSFFGDPWQAVRVEVERVWAIATVMLGGACDCAGKIQVEVNKIDTSSDCKYVATVSNLAEVAALDCAATLVESVQMFDWLTITRNYINTVLIYTKNACFFVGGGAAAAIISLSLVCFISLIHMERRL